ncbi:dimethylaniline monooxygenase [Coniochaeta sp. 2T2.1]|nr:dimethylaniline monooxygenase [Coniochaeta sp. 2T2.1]
MSSKTALQLVEGEKKDDVIANAKTIVTRWLAEFEKALSSTPVGLDSLFLTDSWLKDSLVLSWDQHAVKGRHNITEYVRRQTESGRRLFNLKVTAKSHLQPNLREMGPLVWLESVFDFDTDVGRGRGLVRLANTAVGEWKAWVVFLNLEELNGHPRRIGLNRQPFHQKPEPILDGPDDEVEPTVVIIGAGHCGLSLAACLQTLGVRALCIDRNKRVGDSWRNRYKSLKLHSPNWGDHLPYFDFPTNWPIFPDKDQIADFLEAYARILDLQVWLETEFESANYDDASGRWTVKTVASGGNRSERRTLHASHVVWAGNALVLKHPNIPTWSGSDEFKGRLYHASEHTDAAAMLGPQGKKKNRVVVIGASTTAHDIALDYANAGADVTMIQRGSIIVFSPSSVMKFGVQPPRTGYSTEDAVFEKRSFPLEVILNTILAGVTKIMAANDAEILAGLEKTEFFLEKGQTVGDSFLSRFLKRRGGFYINHGASEAIADGRIRVLRSEKGIDRLTKDGLVLADGREVDADIIVLATSWKNFEDIVGDIMGEDVARRTKGRFGVDKQGELAGVYRPTGHPGFWVASSNFGGSQMGAPVLALQIKAIEEGLNPGLKG